MLRLRLVPALVSVLLAGALHAGDAEDVAEALARGRPDAALARVDRALLQSPRDFRLLLLRGNALAASGRTQDAIRAFADLAAAHPQRPEPLNNLAALYAQTGQFDRARATLEAALRTHPAYATAYGNLTEVYARLAAQAYERALERDVAERRQSSNPPAVTTLAPVRLALIQDVNGVVAELSAPAAKPAASTAPAPTIVAANRPVAPAASPVPQTVPAPAAANPIPAKTAPATSIAQTGTSPTPAPPPAVAVKAQAKPDAKPGPAPLPTPVKPTEPRKDSDKAEEEQVLKTVRGWAEAWSEKRVAVYLGYYARTFKPPGLSRKDWEAQRRERIAGARQIEVKLVNPRVHIEGETATVRFLQRYNSDKTEKSTAKTLVLRRQGERWLITEERVG